MTATQRTGALGGGGRAAGRQCGVHAAVSALLEVEAQAGSSYPDRTKEMMPPCLVYLHPHLCQVAAGVSHTVTTSSCRRFAITTAATQLHSLNSLTLPPTHLLLPRRSPLSSLQPFSVARVDQLGRRPAAVDRGGHGHRGPLHPVNRIDVVLQAVQVQGGGGGEVRGSGAEWCGGI